MTDLTERMAKTLVSVGKILLNQKNIKNKSLKDKGSRTQLNFTILIVLPVRR